MTYPWERADKIQEKTDRYLKEFFSKSKMLDLFLNEFNELILDIKKNEEDNQMLVWSIKQDLIKEIDKKINRLKR